MKDGVNIRGVQPELVLGLIVANEVYASYGVDLTVTSINDGQHMTNSLHYKGMAADLRVKDLHAITVDKIVSRLREKLGKQFDVVLEANPPHVHLEFDPKDVPAVPTA